MGINLILLCFASKWIIHLGGARLVPFHHRDPYNSCLLYHRWVNNVNLNDDTWWCPLAGLLWINIINIHCFFKSKKILRLLCLLLWFFSIQIFFYIVKRCWVAMNELEGGKFDWMFVCVELIIFYHTLALSIYCVVNYKNKW